MTVQPTRCYHCGREVRPTVHGRGGAQVDYYRSVTGIPRVDIVEDPTGTGSTVRVVRVEEVREILTCRDCWAVPSERVALEEAWRTGVLRSEVRSQS